MTHVAECLLERFEPWREIPPLIESFTEERLANLLRTGRTHAALRLVELDALRFELQSAEIENSPHIAFQIIDDILVMDAQNPPRQHAVPMPHQFDIGPVVARDILDAVGELLSIGKTAASDC